MYGKFIKNLGKKHEFNPRIYGSTSGEVAALLEGYLDAVIDLRGLYVQPPRPAKVWDIVAPKPILEDAGFKVTDGRGNPLNYHIESKEAISLVASAPKLHKLIMETIKETFNL